MKLTKSIKRVWAYVLVMALVVSSMVGYQAKSVVADVIDWSAIDYAGDGAGGGTYSNQYKFYCENEGVKLVNIQAPGFATEAGLYVTAPAAISEVSVSSDIQGAGVILHLSNFTNRETLVTITDALGTYICYVYNEKGTDTGEIETPTTEIETTTAALSNWTELFSNSASTVVTDTTNDEGRGASFTGFVTDYTWNADSKWQGQAKLQGIATEAGKTYTVSFDVTSTPAKQILVQALSADVYTEETYDTSEGHIEMSFVANNESAQVTLAFGAMSAEEAGTYDIAISNFVVTEETEEVTSEEVTSEEVTSEEVTSEEVTSEEVTSEEVTSEEATSEPEADWTAAVINGEPWADLGAYTYYVGNWGAQNATASYKGGDELNNLSFRIDSNEGYASYIIQLMTKGFVTEAGKNYKYVVEFNSTTAGSALQTKIEGVTDLVDHTLVEGSNKIEVNFTAAGESSQVFLHLAYVAVGTELEFTNVEVVEVTEEVTTEEATSEEVTSEEVTTEGAGTDDLVYEEVIGENANVTVGNYEVWVCLTNTMMFAADPEDAGHISGYIVNNSNNWDMWAVQYIVQEDGLTPGQTYTISVDFAAGSNDGTITTDAGETFALSTLFDGTTSSEGKVTLTKTVEADANGTVKYVIGAGQVGYGVTIDLSNVVVEAVGGDEPTTEAPTTAEVETTTKTPETTTVSPTTKAPEPTTEAPTTADDKKMKKPAKVTIKKVYAKKKAAKVVKVKFKKVKGATAYQVQISKAKKFTKKNILVNKKAVKKLKPSIKSKKLKNKKKLYVRVRAYVKTASGEKVYGKWSKVKQVKVK